MQTIKWEKLNKKEQVQNVTEQIEIKKSFKAKEKQHNILYKIFSAENGIEKSGCRKTKSE